MTVDPEITESDRIVDELVILALALLRHNAHLRRLAVVELQDLEDEARLLVTESRVLEASRARPRNALDADLDRAVAQAYDRIDRLVAAEMEGLAELVGAFALDAIGDLDLPAGRRAIARETLVFGAPLGEWWAKHAGDLSFRIDRAVSEAMDATGSERDLMAAVGAAFDTAARHSDSLLRTGEEAVLGSSLMAIYLGNPDKVQEIIHISCLDARTTTTCRSRSGRRWSLPDYRPIGHSMVFKSTPIHWGCRSIIAPRIAGEAIPTSPSLDEFLSRRSGPEAETLLGKAGMALYAMGKITQSGLLDQTGRPLSLAQVRRFLGL